ncbi:MAG: hypothetical protein ACI9D0_001120 [Bacteroidia bacterium]|jgi:hypothetical protein
MKVVPLLVLPLCASACLSAPEATVVTAVPGAVATRTSQMDDSAPDERQTYVAQRTGQPIVVDGVLDEQAWLHAVETNLFVDIQGSSLPEPRHGTLAKMLWDDDYFYVAAIMEEPDLWATLTKRDSVIFYDNDFEVFIDPDGDTHDYYELEINAFGTEWDLLLEKPYRDGGPALHEFDTPGLLSGVQMMGTLNDNRDVDQGWTMEIAIPFHALAAIAGRPVPPVDGDVWWVNFSRVQWQLDKVDGERGYVKRKGPAGERLPEDNWVWSPQGVIAMHEPESWGLVMFAMDESGALSVPSAFAPPADLAQRELLHEVYDSMHTLRGLMHSFTEDTSKLSILARKLLAESGCELALHSTPSGFEAVLTWTAGDTGMTLRMDEKGHIW